MKFFTTTYMDLDGDHEAVQIAWDDLGDRDSSDPAENSVIVRELLASGAPAWVIDAEGWTDEYGWGLIGPLSASAGA